MAWQLISLDDYVYDSKPVDSVPSGVAAYFSVNDAGDYEFTMQGSLSTTYSFNNVTYNVLSLPSGSYRINIGDIANFTELITDLGETITSIGTYEFSGILNLVTDSLSTSTLPVKGVTFTVEESVAAPQPLPPVPVLSEWVPIEPEDLVSTEVVVPAYYEETGSTSVASREYSIPGPEGSGLTIRFTNGTVDSDDVVLIEVVGSSSYTFTEDFEFSYEPGRTGEFYFSEYQRTSNTRVQVYDYEWEEWISVRSSYSMSFTDELRFKIRSGFTYTSGSSAVSIVTGIYREWVTVKIPTDVTYKYIDGELRVETDAEDQPFYSYSRVYSIIELSGYVQARLTLEGLGGTGGYFGDTHWSIDGEDFSLDDGIDEGEFYHKFSIVSEADYPILYVPPLSTTIEKLVPIIIDPEPLPTPTPEPDPAPAEDLPPVPVPMGWVPVEDGDITMYNPTLSGHYKNLDAPTEEIIGILTRPISGPVGSGVGINIGIYSGEYSISVYSPGYTFDEDFTFDFSLTALKSVDFLRVSTKYGSERFEVQTSNGYKPVQEGDIAVGLNYCRIRIPSGTTFSSTGGTYYTKFRLNLVSVSYPEVSVDIPVECNEDGFTISRPNVDSRFDVYIDEDEYAELLDNNGVIPRVTASPNSGGENLEYYLDSHYSGDVNEGLSEEEFSEEVRLDVPEGKLLESDVDVEWDIEKYTVLPPAPAEDLPPVEIPSEWVPAESTDIVNTPVTVQGYYRDGFEYTPVDELEYANDDPMYNVYITEMLDSELGTRYQLVFRTFVPQSDGEYTYTYNGDSDLVIPIEDMVVGGIGDYWYKLVCASYSNHSTIKVYPGNRTLAIDPDVTEEVDTLDELSIRIPVGASMTGYVSGYFFLWACAIDVYEESEKFSPQDVTLRLSKQGDQWGVVASYSESPCLFNNKIDLSNFITVSDDSRYRYTVVDHNAEYSDESCLLKSSDGNLDLLSDDSSIEVTGNLGLELGLVIFYDDYSYTTGFHYSALSIEKLVPITVDPEDLPDPIPDPESDPEDLPDPIPDPESDPEPLPDAPDRRLGDYFYRLSLGSRTLSLVETNGIIVTGIEDNMTDYEVTPSTSSGIRFLASKEQPRSVIIKGMVFALNNSSQNLAYQMQCLSRMFTRNRPTRFEKVYCVAINNNTPEYTDLGMDLYPQSLINWTPLNGTSATFEITCTALYPYYYHTYMSLTNVLNNNIKLPGINGMGGYSSNVLFIEKTLDQWSAASGGNHTGTFAATIQPLSRVKTPFGFLIKLGASSGTRTMRTIKCGTTTGVRSTTFSRYTLANMSTNYSDDRYYFIWGQHVYILPGNIDPKDYIKFTDGIFTVEGGSSFSSRIQYPSSLWFETNDIDPTYVACIVECTTADSSALNYCSIQLVVPYVEYIPF